MERKLKAASGGNLVPQTDSEPSKHFLFILNKEINTVRGDDGKILHYPMETKKT